MLASRLERLLAGLAARACDAAILLGPDHAIQFAGYSHYLSGTLATVVDGDGRRTLVVPGYEVATAEAEARADAVVGFGGTDFLDQDQAPKLLAACLRIAATARIGIAGFDARVGTATPIDDLVREIRLRKDAEEIDAIADAQRLALRAQAEVARLVTEGAREIELCSAAASAAQDAAGKPVDVITVLASGPRTAGAAPPVLVPSKRAMGPGDAVLADLAVRHDGYWGDTTRTYACGRSDEIEEARATLSDIARGIAESLRPGLRAREVFEHAQAAIREHFPGQDLIHHAGHGIGLEVGESPQLVPAEDMPLQEGMVLAIEPGVYVSGRYGVRVEDVYVVAPSGSVLVTAHDDER